MLFNFVPILDSEEIVLYDFIIEHEIVQETFLL